jgi:glucose-1-phosphate cytidylyltransferase
MVLLDDKPIIWHLMNIFSIQGYREFVVALGYKGYVIKRWLRDLHELEDNLSISTISPYVASVKDGFAPNWKVDAVETGLKTQTGGRIKKILTSFPDDYFVVTYGDGLANVNIKKLIAFHLQHGKLATITSVRPPARFGHIKAQGNLVVSFGEKIQADEGWINGGFFVLNKKVAEYVHSDDEPFESGALPRLVAERELMTFYHEGFWQPMDTLRERNILSEYTKMSTPPWIEGFSKLV